MIRFATSNDTKGIIELWKESFGDSEKDILFFLDNRFTAENTLIYEDCGEVASMLFLIEGNMVNNNTEYPSYYLYAACTSKKCRGRGMMAKLLEEAKSVAAVRGKYFICLMPGEKSLFEFYERFGYKTVFSRKILNVNVSDLLEKEIISDESVFSDYYTKRKNAFSAFNRFEWDNASIDYACKSHLLYGGFVENSCKGYMLYSVAEDNIVIKEFAFNEKDFIFALKSLFSANKCENAEIYLPTEYKTEIGRCKIAGSAMAVSVKPEFESIISDINNAYLGLTLD